MERINALSLLENNAVIISNDCAIIVDKKATKSIEKIIVKNRINCDILFSEISEEISLDFIVEENGFLNVKGLINGDNLNVNLHFKNEQNSNINVHFVDFSSGISKIDANCDMFNEGASFTWQLASLAAHNDNKKIRVNVEHGVKHLYGDVSNYGVCKDDANLEIAGTTHIINGASRTLTKQNARIMLIDKTSRGIAKPILKIDENDVKASHGATLGQINEEHLFYLKSRGLSESEAKKLIVLGYFNPVILLFKDEECEQYILNLVGERI